MNTVRAIHFCGPLLATALAACGSVNVDDLNPGDFSGSTGASCTSVSAGFQANVYPILTEGCGATGCHGSPGGSGGLTLSGSAAAVYSAATGDSRVSVANPSSSVLLRRALGLDDHGGGQVWGGITDSRYRTVLCWISSGAEND